MTMYFITGTDTDCGKTFYTQNFLQSQRNKGHKTLGLKPIASGSIKRDGTRTNNDALLLQAQSHPKLAYQQHNPILFDEPISPHIENKIHQHTIADIAYHIHTLPLDQYDTVAIEGAGGWLAPLNDREMISDLALALNIPVILVVGMKLGCLNHALLSYHAIAASNVTFHGWVANTFSDPMPYLQDNIEHLIQNMGQPIAIL